MSPQEACEIVKLYKDIPLIEDSEEVIYNDAVNVILNAIENGYELYNTNDLFFKLEKYQSIRKKNNTTFDLGIVQGYEYAMAIIREARK